MFVSSGVAIFVDIETSFELDRIFKSNSVHTLVSQLSFYSTCICLRLEIGIVIFSKPWIFTKLLDLGDQLTVVDLNRIHFLDTRIPLEHFQFNFFHFNKSCLILHNLPSFIYPSTKDRAQTTEIMGKKLTIYFIIYMQN